MSDVDEFAVTPPPVGPHFPRMPTEDYIVLARREFERLKRITDRAMAQLPPENFFATPAVGDNSIAVIVKHVSGNLRSRWTDFLTTDGEKLSAVSNVCAHQNGPLGEGRIVDGFVTCPWHGFQYRPEDGCAPAPFTEKIATYQLRLERDVVCLHTVVNAAGTRVEPLRIPEPVR